MVATTRPETILGDTALCVHPDDERYRHLHGKRVTVPIVGRSIPVIADSYVDMGSVPAPLRLPPHDINDYMLGEKYNLETIDIFNDNGTINDKVGLYVGMDRFELPRQDRRRHNGRIAHAEKIEDYDNKVGLLRTHLGRHRAEAVDAVVPEHGRHIETGAESRNGRRNRAGALEIQEHLPPLDGECQGLVRVAPALVGPANTGLLPPRGGFVVAETAEEALELAKKKSGNDSLTVGDLRQDPDVLDTWFSSWLWPISVFGGILEPDNSEVKYYYPTSDLVTAPDILFFWVARMIIAGYEYRGTFPFKNVYLTGTVRDKQRRKMSKSLGNSPTPRPDSPIRGRRPPNGHDVMLGGR